MAVFSTHVQWCVSTHNLAVDTTRVGNEVQKHQRCVAAPCRFDDARFTSDAGGGIILETRN